MVAGDGGALGVLLGRLDYLVLVVVHLEAERLAADVVDRAHLYYINVAKFSNSVFLNGENNSIGEP